MLRRLSYLVFRLAGWRTEGEPPASHRFVIIAAPHTSNWDAVVMLLAVGVLTVASNAILRHSLDSNATFLRLTQAAPRGGRVLSTSLVTVLRTGDGRLLVGAVPQSRLDELAAQG